MEKKLIWIYLNIVHRQVTVLKSTIVLNKLFVSSLNYFFIAFLSNLTINFTPSKLSSKYITSLCCCPLRSLVKTRNQYILLAWAVRYRKVASQISHHLRLLRYNFPWVSPISVYCCIYGKIGSCPRTSVSNYFTLRWNWWYNIIVFLIQWALKINK